MMIAPVDHRDVHRRTAQRFRRSQPAEAADDDHDMGASGYGGGLRLGMEAPCPQPSFRWRGENRYKRGVRCSAVLDRAEGANSV